MKKALLIIFGCLMVGIGAVGIILPILPTFPFLLAASICFLKSSERLDTWFRGTKMYAKHVEPFAKHRGLTLKTKLAILIPVAALLITMAVLVDNLAMRIVIGVLLAAKTIVFIKMKTVKEEDLHNAKQAPDITVCK